MLPPLPQYALIATAISQLEIANLPVKKWSLSGAKFVSLALIPILNLSTAPVIIGRRFAAGRIPGHTTRAPPVGFELETNCFQFYAIANLVIMLSGHNPVLVPCPAICSALPSANCGGW